MVRKRIRTMSRRTLDPRSRMVRGWDLLMVSALVFTAFVTPFEVAFFEAALFSGPANFTLNRIVDAIYVGDIFISFFMP